MLFLYCVSEKERVWVTGAGINPEPVFSWVIHCNRTQDYHNILVQIMYACRCKWQQKNIKPIQTIHFSFVLFACLLFKFTNSSGGFVAIVIRTFSHMVEVFVLKVVGQQPEKKTWTEKPVYSVFTPLSPSLRCGDFAILLILGWRRPPAPSRGIWLAVRHTRHSSPPMKTSKSMRSSQSERGWDVPFRRRARKRKSAFSNIPTLRFNASTVLVDGAKVVRHGRENKQTGRHLPRYMGPLPRYVFLLFFLSYPWKGHKIEWNVTPGCYDPGALR